jgi:hypothetical protein
LSDIVLLKKADRGNARRARITAGACVLQRDATQSKDRDLVSASYA